MFTPFKMSAIAYINANGVYASQTESTFTYPSPSAPVSHGITMVSHVSHRHIIETRGQWVRYEGQCDWTWTGNTFPSEPPPAPCSHNDEWLDSMIYGGSTSKTIGGSMSSERW